MNTLIAKLARASAKVGALKTDKTNTSQNYSYISSDKVLERAGDALAAEGVVIVPSITGETVQEVTYTDTYGKTKTRYDATVHFSMLITDGESDLTATWAGRGSDFSVPDKAFFKAVTSGQKYLLMKLLNIGVGNEDGEHDGENTGEVKAATTAPKGGAGARPGAQQQPAEGKVEPRAPSSESTRKRLHALGVEFYGEKAAWDEARPGLVTWASKGSVTSSSDLTENEARALIAGLEKKLTEKAKQKREAETPEERHPEGSRTPTAGQSMRARIGSSLGAA